MMRGNSPHCHGCSPMTDTDIATSHRPTEPTPKLSAAEFLTRREAADYIRNILGRPMSFSTASKLAALGEFAQPVTWWGRRPLYSREDLRAWTEARSRSTKVPGDPAPVTAAPPHRETRPRRLPAPKTTTA